MLDCIRSIELYVLQKEVLAMSNEKIEEIIRNSGNNFHCKVVNYLKSKGWKCLISPYYMDNATNKPREIDLISEKAWQWENRLGMVDGTINIKLFVECKYTPQNNIFWFADKDRLSALNWVTSHTPLKKGNGFTDQHHYLSDQKVAKLFASQNKPSPENEVIYKALNQRLNAMVYLRGRESIIPTNHNIRATIEYPVIVCNSFDKFYRIDIENATGHEKISDNFQLEVNYAYIDKKRDNTSEYFLLDIVDFNKIEDYLSSLEEDIKAIMAPSFSCPRPSSG